MRVVVLFLLLVVGLVALLLWRRGDEHIVGVRELEKPGSQDGGTSNAQPDLLLAGSEVGRNSSPDGADPDKLSDHSGPPSGTPRDAIAARLEAMIEQGLNPEVESQFLGLLREQVLRMDPTEAAHLLLDLLSALTPSQKSYGIDSGTADLLRALFESDGSIRRLVQSQMLASENSHVQLATYLAQYHDREHFPDLASDAFALLLQTSSPSVFSEVCANLHNIDEQMFREAVEVAFHANAVSFGFAGEGHPGIDSILTGYESILIRHRANATVDQVVPHAMDALSRCAEATDSLPQFRWAIRLLDEAGCGVEVENILLIHQTRPSAIGDWSAVELARRQATKR